MHLFIDTNVFLSFFHFTGEDLEELKKLSALLDSGELVLHIPEQVKNEFFRNRENKISEAIASLGKVNFGFQYPQMCKDYDEFEEMQNIQKEFGKLHDNLLRKIKSDAISKSLNADNIITDLFSKATMVSTTANHINKARQRIAIGNPPGKNGSLGDAINWEIMLESIPTPDDIYFISGDKDYCSKLSKTDMKSFLVNEWTTIKRTDIHFYNKISIFFKQNYPDIKIASDVEKELCIRDLATSSSFSLTHSVVSELRDFDDFSLQQAESILSICLSNNQVCWIITDHDVKALVTSILEKHKDKLDSRKVTQIEELINEEEAEVDEAITTFEDRPF